MTYLVKYSCEPHRTAANRVSQAKAVLAVFLYHLDLKTIISGKVPSDLVLSREGISKAGDSTSRLFPSNHEMFLLETGSGDDTVTIESIPEIRSIDILCNEGSDSVLVNVANMLAVRWSSAIFTELFLQGNPVGRDRRLKNEVDKLVFVEDGRNDQNFDGDFLIVIGESTSQFGLVGGVPYNITEHASFSEFELQQEEDQMIVTPKGNEIHVQCSMSAHLKLFGTGKDTVVITGVGPRTTILAGENDNIIDVSLPPGAKTDLQIVTGDGMDIITVMKAGGLVEIDAKNGQNIILVNETV